MRRDALLLDLMDLERVAQLKGAVLAGIESRVAEIRSIQASGELSATVELDAQLESFREAGSSYAALVSAERARVDAARSSLQPLEAEIGDRRAGADKLDSEVQELRGKAAISEPERALPYIAEARQKLNEAQDLRLAASTAEQGAEPLRSAVRIGSAALGEDDPAASMLAARVSAAQQAVEAARTRAAAAKSRTEGRMAEIAEAAKELQRLQTELYEPAVKSVEEAFQAGEFPSRGPTDNAVIAIARARFAAIRADDEGQGLLLATAVGAGDGTAAEQIRAERAKLIDEAKAALVEARDGLAGADATVADPMLRSIETLAASLGIDLPSGRTPAGAAPTDEPPADTANSEPAADASPAAPAGDDAGAPPADPVEPGAEPMAPPADPSSPPADPSTPPADPADPSAPPADPTPPPADPGSDEPNK
jgi:predicted  nucleic acid-binding Zn-ribbon protein